VIVGIGGWRGTGATTLATVVASGLAARGRSPWLIEADPAGGVLAARLDLSSTAGGLERIAFPDGRAAGTAVERLADAATVVNGTRVVTSPGDPFRAWACHLPRLPWAPLLRELDEPVLVDLGRIRGAAPNAPLLAQLDVLILVASSDAVAVVSSIEWAGAHGRVSPGDAGLALDITRIAVVETPGSQSSVSRTDVETELGDRFAGWLPWSPTAVDLVERGAAFGDRRLRRQPLVHAVDAVIDRLETWASDEVAA
jgi:hypothetical protein